jgi:hypothetical protein
MAYGEADSDELMKACARWVVEASVERRPHAPQAWPPSRRMRLGTQNVPTGATALESAPRTPPRSKCSGATPFVSSATPVVKKSVQIVKGTVALFCPQPCEPTASAADDPYTSAEEPDVKRAPRMTAVQRASAELAAARMMQKHLRDEADGDKKQPPERPLRDEADEKPPRDEVDGDEKQHMPDEVGGDEKQLVGGDEKQLVGVDEKLLIVEQLLDEDDKVECDDVEKQQREDLALQDMLRGARDRQQKSEEEQRERENAYRLDMKKADEDFPGPPWKDLGEPWQERGDGTPSVRKLCSTGVLGNRKSRTTPAPPAKKQRWTHDQWLNWKTTDDGWINTLYPSAIGAKPKDAKPMSASYRREAKDYSKAIDADWQEEKNDWQEEKNDWQEEKKYWHEEKNDWQEEKSDWPSMMNAAIARWKADGQAQALRTGRRTKRRAGAKIQENRKLASSAPDTIQALKRATAKTASHSDLDLLFKTFGPQALAELVEEV